MKKPEKTQQELEQIKAVKDQNKAVTVVKNMVKKICESRGLRVAEFQLEYLKKNHTILPHPLLDKSNTIAAFEKGINEYTSLLNC
jgi:hypothetical protein